MVRIMRKLARSENVVSRATFGLDEMFTEFIADRKFERKIPYSAVSTYDGLYGME